jgi:hypothetical protein
MLRKEREEKKFRQRAKTRAPLPRDSGDYPEFFDKWNGTWDHLIRVVRLQIGQGSVTRPISADDIDFQVREFRRALKPEIYDVQVFIDENDVECVSWAMVTLAFDYAKQHLT